MKEQKLKDRHEMLKITHKDPNALSNKGLAIKNKEHSSLNTDMKTPHNL